MAALEPPFDLPNSNETEARLPTIAWWVKPCTCAYLQDHRSSSEASANANVEARILSLQSIALNEAAHSRSLPACLLLVRGHQSNRPGLLQTRTPVPVSKHARD